MRIDILLRDKRPYSFENYAAAFLQKAFEKKGIYTQKIVASEGNLREYTLFLKKDPPSWTLSFEDLFRLQKPFCDIVQIPHFFWEKNSLSDSVAYLNSSYGKIGFPEKRAARDFELYFLPHAVDPNIQKSDQHKEFEVVFFSDLIDLENKENAWKDIFSQEGARLLKKGVVMCQKNPAFHPYAAALSIETEEISLNDRIFEIEEYLRAEKIQKLVESFKGFRVDVFGEHIGNNWLKKLKNRESISLHSGLPYTEYFEVLKTSKLLVRYMPSFSDGSDEWILPSIASGCFVLVNPNPFLENQLNDHQFFYQSTEELAKKGQAFLKNSTFSFDKKVLSENSWEKRAATILEFMKDET